jgi:hypothetical protein
MRSISLIYNDKIKNDLTDSIWSEELKEMAEAEVLKLKPICDFIDFVQSRDCSVAKSVDEWIQMERVQGFAEQRENICNSYALIAYTHHPSIKGIRLSEGQLAII